MNRLECLQLYPMKSRKFLYFAAPFVFIFFTVEILIIFFGFSFKEAQNCLHFPAILGGVFYWYVSSNDSQTNQKESRAKGDIEADPHFLREALEKTNHSIKHMINGLIGVFAATFLLRPPFFREIGQMVDILIMCGFFAAGAYFRQVLHVYERTPWVPEKELGERYSERKIFQLLGWMAFGFFFLKTLGPAGKMGASWSGLPEVEISSLWLVAAVAVYAIGVLGIFIQIEMERTEGSLNGLFNACMAFGTAFPLVWLYPLIHPYTLLELPSWLIQLPGLVLVVVNSIGIYFSFQASLREKIVGNSCLWFVRLAQQVLIALLIWSIAVHYAGMNPIAAAILYGCFFTFLSWTEGRTPILAAVAGVIVLAPILIKIGEFPANAAAQRARIEQMHDKNLSEKEQSD